MERGGGPDTIEEAGRRRPVITLYEKSNCQQCRATARYLEDAGLDFTSVSLDDNPQAVDLVKAMGYAQAPVVVTDTDHWSGFRPDKLATLNASMEQSVERPDSQPVLDSLNPTGSVVVEYAPHERATAPLGEDMTTLAATAGMDPEAKVQIFRGVPGAAGPTIAAGDFVTTNRQLAKDYAGTGRVIEATVRAGDILDSKSEPGGEEYIYRPHADRELSDRDPHRQTLTRLMSLNGPPQGRSGGAAVRPAAQNWMTGQRSQAQGMER